MKKKMLLFLLFIVVMSAFAASTTFKTKAGLQLDLLSQDPATIQPGETVELKFRVQNVGRGVIDSVKVRLEDSNAIQIIGQREFDFGDLYVDIQGGDSIIFYTTGKISETIGSGNYPIDATIISGISKFSWKDWLVRVERVSSDVSIQKVEYSADQLTPGEISTVKLTFKNNDENRLNNFEVNLNLDGLSIAPFGSTTKKTVDAVRGGDEFVIEYDLIVDPNTASEVYKIPFKYTYQDIDRKSFNDSGVFALLVSNPPAYVINLKETEGMVVDNIGNIILDVANTGSSELKFLNVQLLESSDYIIERADREYIGNLDSDDLDTASFSLKPLNEGLIPLKFRVNFKDDFNKEYSEDFEINTEVYSRSAGLEKGMITQPASYGFVYFTIGAVFLTFWIFMLMNLLQNKTMTKQQKYIWLFLLIAGNVVGAALYYFLARKV